jgi:membrane-associated PAP2 superfamily phosphatase
MAANGGIVAVTVVVLVIFAFGARPDWLEQVCWLLTIIVLGAANFTLSRMLRGRHSTLEDWTSTLEYRSKVLDDFHKELRYREQAVIWGEGKAR